MYLLDTIFLIRESSIRQKPWPVKIQIELDAEAVGDKPWGDDGNGFDEKLNIPKFVIKTDDGNHA